MFEYNHVDLNLLYIWLIVICMCLMGVLYVKNKLAGFIDSKNPVSFLYVSGTLLMGVDLLWACVETFDVWHTGQMVFTLNALWHVMFISTAVTWCAICNNDLSAVKIRGRVAWGVTLTPAVIALILVLSSCWNRWIVDVTPENNYARGKYFYIIYLICFAYNILGMILCLLNGLKAHNQTEYRFSLATMFVPLPFLLTMLLQVWAGFEFGYVGLIASLAMYDIDYARKRTQAAVRSQRDKDIATLEKRQLAEKQILTEMSNREKEQFITNMVQDLEAPLGAISNMLDSIKPESDSNEAISEKIQKIKWTSKRLLTILTEMQEMSNISNEHVQLHEVHADIFLCCKEINPMLEEMAAAKHIQYQMTFGDIQQRFIYLDIPHTERILWAVITNAIKFTPAKGTVTMHVEQVSDVVNSKALYRFTVTDSGIGISQEFLPKIFDSFAKEDNSSAAPNIGVGLGLSIAKRLVTLMNGKIDVQSEQNKGSVFTITLPFRVQSFQEIYSESKPASADAEKLSGKRVLIVDDNDLTREMIRNILEERQIAVEEAADGSGAVRMIQQNPQDYYDFILMDLNMPTMNGFDAVKTIRCLTPKRHIPVFALSANDFEEDRLRSLAGGMDDHQVKPVVASRLFESMLRFL